MNRKSGDTASAPALTDDHTTSVTDVKQLGLFAAIGSLGYVFWVVGGMEMIERLAYFGVRSTSALYATDPRSKGGLGVTMGDVALLYGVWAIVQSILPVFTGALSDRYGYKETIFASTVLKICGYLIMAWFPTYGGFFAGAVVLATGTAIFKPGIQGTLVRATSRRNSSIAWGIFYQTVNIGGYLGPLVAGRLRLLEWRHVFYVCAAIISLNFLLLLAYKEIGKDERLERERRVRAGTERRTSLWRDSIHELFKPHVWTYLVVFSGFWFMLMTLWDVLPVHIRDWVNTSDIVHTLFPAGASDNKVVNFLVITNDAGTAIQPEGMVNINTGLIMITCFLFAAVSAKMRATTSMVVGTLLASVALMLSGYAVWGWLCAGAIALFSVGEMLSSPKFSEFIGNFAPGDKKAMYLGFSQLPVGIGWSLEGFIAPSLYERLASKDRFARELLEERIASGSVPMPDADTLGQLAARIDGVDAARIGEMLHHHARDLVAGIPQGEAFDWLVTLTRQTPETMTEVLRAGHNIGLFWYIMGGVGIVTAACIWCYGRWVVARAETR